MRPQLQSVLFLLLGMFHLLTAQSTSAAPAHVEITKTAVSFTALHPGQHAVAAVVAEIRTGFHTRSHADKSPRLAFNIKLQADDAAKFADGIYPTGVDKDFPGLGQLNIYEGKVVTFIPFDVSKDAKPGPLKITGSVKFQACDDSQCFTPESKSLTIDTTIVAADQPSEPAEVELFKDAPKAAASPAPPEATPATLPSEKPASPPKAEANVPGTEAPIAISATPALPKTVGEGEPFRLESLYTTKDLKTVLDSIAAGRQPGKLAGADWNASYAFGVAFLVGLIFNIMPCVLPVLPLKAIGFYEVGQHKRSRSFLFGLVFSLGIVAAFGLLAIPVVVLKKIAWGSFFSEPWFIWPMSALLVAMAFGLFGAFTFRLPLGAYSFEPRHDTFSGNFLLGVFTAVLATPCTAPLLPPLLVWAASQPTLGPLAMLMVGVGMASPYLILSALPELARKFPRTGPWSELFKQMMGFMLLAAAAFLAGGRIIHSANYWWIVVAVVAMAALFLMARTVQLSKNATPVGVSAVLAVVMLGGILWWTAQVTGIAQPPMATGKLGSFQTYSPELFDSLRKQHKIVLVKFTASWCATCQVIEGTVYQDPTAWQALADNNVVALKADFSDDNPTAQLLLNHLSQTGGIPLTAVYPPLANGPVAAAR